MTGLLKPQYVASNQEFFDFQKKPYAFGLFCPTTMSRDVTDIQKFHNMVKKVCFGAPKTDSAHQESLTKKIQTNFEPVNISDE